MARVVFIIPAYNEEKSISIVIDDLLETAKKNRIHDYQIVVVSDGSKDNTAKNAKKHLNTHVIEHVINMGAGAATRTGLVYARQNKFDYAVTLDADGQHLSDDVIKVLTSVESGSSDVVIGNRLWDKKGMPLVKRVGNWGLSFITQIIYGSNIKDSQSGLRGFNQKAIQKVNYTSNRYAFCSEMLWRLKLSNLSVTEVPINAIYTDYSKASGRGQSNWGAFEIVKHMLLLRIKDAMK